MPELNDELRDRIRAEFAKYPSKRAASLPALHIVHDALRCISPAAIKEIAELLEIHPSELFDTMSFYGFYRDESRPLGKRRVWVCRSISCMLRGGEELLAELHSRLGVRPGETSSDGKITLEFAECLGACDGAPCLLVDDECHMNQTTESATELIRNLA
jgi:NADH-quinone oxidoreductase subunit E